MDLKEKEVSRKTIFNGHVVHLDLCDVITPSGKNATREVIHHNGGAAILAVKDNKILLEEQYRFPYDEVIIEIPAGKLEIGENPLDAAYREFEEETGYKALRMEELGTMYPSCGYTDEKIYMYYTDDFVESKQNLDEDEFVNLAWIDIPKVLDLINNDIIKDAKTICAIHKYLNRKK